MTCDRVPLPGGGVAIVCTGPAKRKPPKRQGVTCTRCGEPLARTASQKLCAECMKDLT